MHYCVKCIQIRNFFWSVFSRIRTAYGEIRSISPYSVRMRANTDPKKLRIWTLFTQCRSFRIFREVAIIGGDMNFFSGVDTLILKSVNSTSELIFWQLLPHTVTEEQENNIHSIWCLHIECFIKTAFQKVFISIKTSVFKMTLKLSFHIVLVHRGRNEWLTLKYMFSKWNEILEDIIYVFSSCLLKFYVWNFNLFFFWWWEIAD